LDEISVSNATTRGWRLEVFPLCGGVGTHFRSLLLACRELQLFVNIMTLIAATLCECCMTSGVVHVFECQITSLEGCSLDGVKYFFGGMPLVFCHLTYGVCILPQKRYTTGEQELLSIVET
jgi:hypothetical protein